MKKLSGQSAIFAVRAVIVLLLIVFASLVFKVLAGGGPIIATVDPDQQRQRVNVFAAQAVAVNRQWTGFGTAEAIDSANVPARVTATIDRIPPETLEGATVQKGQVLVVLDDSDFVNQLQVAEQNQASLDAQIEELDRQDASLVDRMDVERRDLALAKNELARIKGMFEKNAANQKDMDAAERTALSAERSLLMVEETQSSMKPKRDQLLARKAELAATADTARLNVERCSIKSPIDGIIQHVDVEVGESVTPGQRVARVVNPQRIQTPLSLSANARSHVRVGDPAILRSTADPGLTWQAVVKRIAPEDDPDSRTFMAYVEVDQPASSAPAENLAQVPLSPGVFIRGTVVASRNDTRVVIPRRSIRTQRVMVVQDDVIQSQLITEAYALDGPIPETHLPDEEWAVLSDGVEPGDVVILTPTRSLSDGQLIEPVMFVDKIVETGNDNISISGQRGDAR